MTKPCYSPRIWFELEHFETLQLCPKTFDTKLRGNRNKLNIQRNYTPQTVLESALRNNNSNIKNISLFSSTFKNPNARKKELCFQWTCGPQSFTFRGETLLCLRLKNRSILSCLLEKTKETIELWGYGMLDFCF